MKIFWGIIICIWIFFVMPLNYVNWHNQQILDEQWKIIDEKLKVTLEETQLIKKATKNKTYFVDYSKLDAKYDSLNRAFDDSEKRWIELW